MSRHHIEVSNRLVHYCLDLEEKVTVLKGNSATGKTELIRLITDYNQCGQSSGVTVLSDWKCSVLTGENWQMMLKHMHQRIMFADQKNTFLTSRAFADAVRDSDNDFVLICRDPLYLKTRHVYGLKESETHEDKGTVWNEMYRISD